MISHDERMLDLNANKPGVYLFHPYDTTLPLLITMARGWPNDVFLFGFNDEEALEWRALRHPRKVEIFPTRGDKNSSVGRYNPLAVLDAESSVPVRNARILAKLIAGDLVEAQSARHGSMQASQRVLDLFAACLLWVVAVPTSLLRQVADAEPRGNIIMFPSAQRTLGTVLRLVESPLDKLIDLLGRQVGQLSSFVALVAHQVEAMRSKAYQEAAVRQGLNNIGNRLRFAVNPIIGPLLAGPLVAPAGDLILVAGKGELEEEAAMVILLGYLLDRSVRDSPQGNPLIIIRELPRQRPRPEMFNVLTCLRQKATVYIGASSLVELESSWGEHVAQEVSMDFYGSWLTAVHAASVDLAPSRLRETAVPDGILY